MSAASIVLVLVFCVYTYGTIFQLYWLIKHNRNKQLRGSTECSRVFSRGSVHTLRSGVHSIKSPREASSTPTLIIRIPASAFPHQTHTPDEGRNTETILEATRQETDPSYWRLSRDDLCRLVDTPAPPRRLTGPWASMLKHTEVCVWGGDAELQKKEPLLLCLGARGPMQATVPQNQTRTCFMKIISHTTGSPFVFVTIGRGMTIKKDS